MFLEIENICGFVLQCKVTESGAGIVRVFVYCALFVSAGTKCVFDSVLSEHSSKNLSVKL